MPLFKRRTRRATLSSRTGATRAEASGNVQETEKDDRPHTSGGLGRDSRRVQKCLNHLHTELGVFSAECRQLGRSYALMMATRELRLAINIIISNFQENISMVASKSGKTSESMSGLPTAPLRSLPEWLRNLGEAFETLRARLDEFREYTDESRRVKNVLGNLARDIKYRASCLDEYSDFDGSAEIRLYIHDIFVEILDDLGDLASTLKFLNRYGLPAMKYEQNRETDVVLTISTVSTFFSAVTITALQVSLGVETLSHAVALVNTFWFCALIMSIGSALNSILAVVWKRTPYGSRGRRLPLSITVWIHASPPLLLGISIVCFFAGLAVYSYAVPQFRYTQVVILAAIAVASFGLMTIVGWLGFEVYLAPLWLPVASWKSSILSLRDGEDHDCHPEVEQHAHHHHHRSRANSLSERSDGSTHTDFSSAIFPAKLATRIHEELLKKPLQAKELFRSRSRQATDVENQDRGRTIHDYQHDDSSHPYHGTNPASPSWKRSARLALTVRSASESFMRSLSMGSNGSRSPLSPADMQMTPPLHSSLKQSQQEDHPVGIVSTSHGDIHDVEFSPLGDHLAVCCYEPISGESMTIVYSVEALSSLFSFKSARSTVKQASWCQDGTYLLVRHDHQYEVIDRARHTRKIIKRPHTLEACTWYTDSAFISAERSSIIKISLTGEVLLKVHRFHNRFIRDIALVPHTSLLLVACRVTSTGGGEHEPIRRAEKQIIVFDVEAKSIIGQAPFLNDIRQISVASSLSKTRGYDVFLGCKHQGQLASPLHWSLQPRLSGAPVLKPGNSLDVRQYVGRTDFFGNGHEMILRSTRDGAFEIADRETGDLSWTIPIKTIHKTHNQRSVAWARHASEDETYILAGVDSKDIKIWIVNLSKRRRVARSASA